MTVVVASTVAGCVLAGVFAIRAARCSRDIGVVLTRWWIGIAITMFLLAANRAFALQAHLTDAFRDAALAEGWYRDRREVQLVVLVLLTIVAVVVLATLVPRLKPALPSIGPSFFGALAMVSIVLLRLVSFHYVDVLTTDGIRVGVRVLEMALAAAVCVHAYRAGARSKSAAAVAR